MKKALVFLCTMLLVFGVVGSASATLFLSGDGNITEPLNAASLYYDTGNQQFFTNILQGGTNVGVLETNVGGGAADFDIELNTFYNSLPGVTSNLFSGTVTGSLLAGTDLFFAPLPDDAFAPSEITALSDLLTGGGSIFFLGENNLDVFPTHNAFINEALAGLGSGMSIIDALFDTGFHTATTGSQIAADPFTAGVTTFTYAAPSQVALVDGGNFLFFGTGGQPFVAYEETAPVPEPATMLLLGSGLIGLAGLGRKKFFKRG